MHRFLGALFPPSASNLAPQVDGIFFALLALCGAVAILIFLVAVFFCIRYRRGSSADRTPPKGGPLRFEITWTVIPFFIFLGLFFWAAKVFFAMSRPPADATEIHIVGKQWMWKIQHPDGRREINELHIPVGHPVKLVMTSQDVIHDFFIPGFRTKQDVVPGRYTTEWFTPTKPGQYHLFCAQYCGTDHSKMVGTIYVWNRPSMRNGWPASQRRIRLPPRANVLFAIAVAAAVTRPTPRFGRRSSMAFTEEKFRWLTGPWSQPTSNTFAIP